MKSNTRTGLVIGIAAIVVILVAGLIIWQKPAASPSNPDASTNKEQTTNTTDDNETVAATITYGDAGFSPSVYKVKTNDSVRVANNSSRDLEFSSDDHPVHTDEPELNMKKLAPGESGTFTVTKTGTWGFHNHLDDRHTGSLEVE